MSVFIKGKTRRVKRGHLDNPTLRIRNPSIIAPTSLHSDISLEVSDYGKKHSLSFSSYGAWALGVGIDLTSHSPMCFRMILMTNVG